jgi:hypothetical protein
MNQLPDLNGCGAAFLLHAPAKKTVTWPHPDGRVAVRQGAAYLTVELARETPEEMVRDDAWRIAQEVLDIHAVQHREALATHRGDSEYLTWIRVNGKQHLTVVEMVNAPWSMSASITVGNSAGPTVHLGASDPSSFSKIVHHPALRFYRLSQLTDDLFDAFRNAYLCLECLVSDESAKGSSEGEPDWLKRVLAAQLAGAVPHGVNSATLVDEIYRLGRLPLFHAKMGKSFLTPYGKGRDQVHAVFMKLNALLMGIFRQRWGPALLGGWGSMSELARDAMARSIFQIDDALFKCAEREVPVAVLVDIVDQPRRFDNLWARIRADVVPTIASIDSLALRKGSEVRLSLTFPERLPLAGLESIAVEILFATYNDKAPRPSYPR